MQQTATIAAEESMPNETAVVRIRKDLRNRAKVQAAIEEVTLEELLNKAIQLYLAEEAGQP